MTPSDLEAVISKATKSILDTRNLDVTVVPDKVTVERPRNPEHGDYATNIALQIAKRVGLVPRELADLLVAELRQHPAIDDADVAGPGFVNIRLAADAQGEILRQVMTQGSEYGSGSELAGIAINLEFVSANPTGPIHLGGTRWAAVGDSLGRVLAARGAAVTREYYFNDHGSQIDRFVDSLIAAAKGEPVPDQGYKGAYIDEIAEMIVERHPDVMDLPLNETREVFRSIGVEHMFAHIKRTLHEFGTDFDVFFHENSLFESGAVDAAIRRLKENDTLYEAEGAWWLRSTDFGDDKDRVVIKSDGNAAYIAGDIAYLKDKHDRGFELTVYMLGADHHGYIARLKAAASALGYDPDTVQVLIGQMVNLVRDGVAVKMSKRAGTVVTLDDLVEAIGVDAARYALVRSSVDSSLDIDLDLWTKHSNDNPVFYVQYAHARLSSLARNAKDLGVTTEGADLSLLSHPLEGTLIRSIGEYPQILATAAELREPHRIARYLEQLAGDYHRFYDSQPILPKAADLQEGKDPEASIHAARFLLSMAARQTLANGLNILGVSAPERM